MNRVKQSVLSWPLILSLIVGGSALASGVARAQDQDDSAPGDVRNDNTRPQEDFGQAGDTQNQNVNQGVVRLARFSYVKGNVTWRADQSLDWSAATTNLPLRQDAQIWVTDGGRAELQFDDGSVLRLGNGALVTLKTLYSDEDGEFTQITLNEGLATLRARHERGVYRIDTPLASITAKGPAKVRFGIGDGLELAVRQGQANVEGDAGKVTLESGDYLDLRDAQSPLDPRRLPALDNWDHWNQERDEVMDGSVERPSHRNLPANIAIVANDLDDYGSWRSDPEYGNVWCPRVTAVDWRPYHDGRWTWVSPFGWTWVSNEAWGWAPYHYGTWVSRSYGWAWCPGPVNQYWSPAVVHFSEYEDRVAWVPLAPREVRYPSALTIGFRSGNWAAFFSIGQAAVYYPSYNNYCVARPFNTGYVNHVTYVNHITNVTNVYNNSSPSFNRYYNSAEFYASNRNTYLRRSQFIPYNARSAAGVTTVSASGFGKRTAYQGVSRTESAALFTNGRIIGAPAGHERPVMGPVGVRPTRESLTPSRTFVATQQPSSRAMARPVFQAPLPAAVARRAASITPSGQVIRQDPNSQVTQTRRDGRNLLGVNSRNDGRPVTSGNNPVSNAGQSTMPPALSTRRGNGADTANGAYNRTANGTTNGTASGTGTNGGTTSRPYDRTGTGTVSGNGGITRNPREGYPRDGVNTGRTGTGAAPNTSSAGEAGNGNGYVRRGEPSNNSPVRTVRPGDSGRTDTGGNSAAEAARRARGTLGLPSGRTGAGNGGNASGGNSASGSSGSSGYNGGQRPGGFDTSERSYRDANGGTHTYRPGSGSSGNTNTSGTGSSSGYSGRTGNSASGDTRWSAERARGRGSDSGSYTPPARTVGDYTPRNSSPTPRTGGDSAPRTYTPSTRGDGDSNPRSYTPRNGYGNSPGYTPSSPRNGSDGGARTYSPPPRTSVPEPSRQTGGGGSAMPSPRTGGSMPPPRSGGSEGSSRPASSDRDRSGGRSSGSSDKESKDKGSGDRGGRGR